MKESNQIITMHDIDKMRLKIQLVSKPKRTVLTSFPMSYQAHLNVDNVDDVRHDDERFHCT